MTENHITIQPIQHTLEANYMPYAMSVIISRALPEIDGLKPSQRKILYTMYKMGLLKGAKTKSANVVGQTMKLHPHGDMAIYETMVRLTIGHEAFLHPFIESKGNMGKHYSRDTAYAAARYTEVKLAPIAETLFMDIDKDTVDFVDNYDGTMKEPKLLPCAFPNILVNAGSGIAVGMASRFCSFNLKEVCIATAEYMKDKETNIEEFLIAPDFPTGGHLIYDKKQMKAIYEKGSGSFKLRADYSVDKKDGSIEIHQIPYTTSVEAIIDSIAGLVKQGKIKEILDVRDETDLKGLKIAIDVKKSTDYELLMNKLFHLTPLEDSFSCNFTMIIGNAPVQVSVRDILDEWIAYRMECVRRQIAYDLRQMREKLHLLQGLAKILLDIDKAISIIRKTEKDNRVIQNLMDGFSIDRVQAEFIADIRLRHLNKEYILKRTDEMALLEKDIQRGESTLKSKNKLQNVIIDQLKKIAKQVGKSRSTRIIEHEEHEPIDQEQLIDDYNVKVFLTKDGYVKKIPLISLRANPQHKLKDKDFITQQIEATNKADLLVFTDQCTVYKTKLYDLDDHKASQLGVYLENALDMEQNERVLAISVTEDYQGHMLFFFENGKAAKIKLHAYETKTNRKKLANAYYANSRVIKIMPADQTDEVVLISILDKVVYLSTKKISAKSSRQSMGVQVIKFKKDDALGKVMMPEQMQVEDVDYYRNKTVPAVGRYLKKGDQIRDDEHS